MVRKSLIAAFIGLMALPLGAQAEREFKKPYYMQQEPTISGTVESVTEHSITVATEGGEHMTFQVDSHSLLPARLTPETKVWIEYALLDNGDHRAIRVSPLGTGELAPYQGERPRASEFGEGEGSGPVSGTYEVRPAGTDHQMGDQVATDVEGTEEANESAAKERTEEAAEGQQLPRTASPWPLLESLGVMLFVTGSVLWFARRRNASRST